MIDNDENAQVNTNNNMLQFDSQLILIETGSLDATALRSFQGLVKTLICGESNGAIHSTTSLSKVLKAAHNNPKVKRFAALLVLRLLNVPNSLPNKQEDPDIDTNIAELVEDALPEFCKAYNLSGYKQTYEKIAQMQQIHMSVMAHLLPMKHMPVVMQDIVSQKEEIYRGINNKLVKSYLQEYDYGNIRNQIYALFERAEHLVKIEVEQFGIKLEELKGLVLDNIEYARRVSSFLSRDYYLPLLESFENATNQLDKDSTRKLDCSINPKKSSTCKAEKKYPLHELGREVKITMPLINSGPGIAQDVHAVVLCDDDGIAINETFNLGAIRPGEFPFTLNVLILNPVKEITLIVDLTWRVMGQIELKTMSFSSTIQAQDPDVDWKSLTYKEPYSTEIAEGDEFVGRKLKVAVLAKRLLKPRMQSSYITGQKRIGKTSLAKAAIEALKIVGQGQGIETMYIEWGDVAHSDPKKSVEALGNAIARFFRHYLPTDEKEMAQEFSGSLAPLNAMANRLRDKQPHNKFVIVLDEFDEIPPEMYRHGTLAEAFFSNLRTLSSKNNVAFMLVGGEKMPFIMGAQGDQLNKFVGEQLDYFSRTEEYQDYIELVRKPVHNILTWSEGTIEELFDLTNGHPFYTKLICSSIFSSAVSDRDADISVRDIQRAVTNIVYQLGVNQFAHHWKDGISKSEEEEPVSLARCRVLVAIGRTMRKHNQLNIDNIGKNNSVKLAEHQVKAILTDFCRRDILKEEDGLYRFVVPLFGMWLEQTGADRIISDRFGDEVAAGLEDEEEKARISSSEIMELVQLWPAYRGREITAENVRGWLEQVGSFREQRLLFTILKSLRFVTESDIREKLRLAHEAIRKVTPLIVTTDKKQKRNDIIVTYVDGEAKSGQYYAGRYAEENKISSICVIGPVDFSKRSKAYEDKYDVTVNGIVIVDDIIATGDSLSNAIKAFVEENRDYIKERSIKLVIVALLGTKKGVEKVERTIESLDGVNPVLRIMEPLEDRFYAFSEEPGIWSSQEDFQRGKALCINIGARMYKKNPLGFGGMGLLVVFPNTCPNNSLPIIHSLSKEPNPWNPLFPRPVN